MVNNSKDLEKLKLFTGMQHSEANLHWSRNNYFLMCSSILLLALSQFEARTFQFLVASLGLVLNIAWLLIQHRSSKYILYWKTEAQKLTSSGEVPNIYPKNLGGFEMRKVAYVLPIAFIVIWVTILVILLALRCL